MFDFFGRRAKAQLEQAHEDYNDFRRATDLAIEARDRKIHQLETQRNKEVKILTIALGAVLAKLNPLLGIPEDDPVRKESSDRIGNEIIDRLEAEEAARNAMEPK